MEEFQKNYERPRVPVLLTNLVDKWPCYKKWNWDYLANMYSEDIHAGGYTFRMNDYILYMQESHDEQPLYIFDKKFVEKSQKQTLHNGIDRDISSDYSVPDFSEMKMTCFLSLEVKGDRTIGGLSPAQLAPDLVFTLIQMVQMLGML